jgi:hypothetical protein
MDKDGIRAIYYSIATTSFMIGAVIEKTYIFSPLGFCFIYVGNMISSRKL